MEPMLQFFAYEHLPDHLKAVSKPFGDLAQWMATNLPRNPERSAGLRKLLEAKDCAVRAKLFEPPAAAAEPLLRIDSPGGGMMTAEQISDLVTRLVEFQRSGGKLIP